MKHRTNQARAERKNIKAIARSKKLDADQAKQIHTAYHSKPSYAAIMNSIRQKTSVITIRNAHARLNISRIKLFPKILWTTGTYILAKHGKLSST